MSQAETASTAIDQIHCTELDHIVLWVADLERSKRFYVDLLGCTVLREHLGPPTDNEDPLDADCRCFLGLGQNQIGLFQRGALEDGTTRFNHVALRIASGSRDEVRAYLEARGVEVRGRRGDPGCLYARDPDGHLVQLLTPNED